MATKLMGSDWRSAPADPTPHKAQPGEAYRSDWAQATFIVWGDPVEGSYPVRIVGDDGSDRWGGSRLLKRAMRSVEPPPTSSHPVLKPLPHQHKPSVGDSFIYRGSGDTVIVAESFPLLGWSARPEWLVLMARSGAGEQLFRYYTSSALATDLWDRAATQHA